MDPTPAQSPRVADSCGIHGLSCVAWIAVAAIQKGDDDSKETHDFRSTCFHEKKRKIEQANDLRENHWVST